MQSYPPEFTGHHVPLMFVAGLGAAPPTAATSPSAPNEPPTSTSPAPVGPITPSDSFDALLQGLRRALVSRKSWHVWDNSRGANHDFHVIAVDKSVRFPPLKARPSSANTAQPPAPLHSPISPLSPASPLYPDGIMAPIWIRKHREMIPAVFVLVLRLGEFDYSSAGPLDTAHKDEQEREFDAALVNEILDRKRSTIERGIKLAVVLLCSRRLLDDPTLDTRLSLVRRQSGLDTRASLFVISPVPQSEINNFALSLRAELFPAAMDYYREHGRRVRRKRARQVPKGGLSDKGWAVRYDYKMGLFSEMRGEIEVALKHYEDCYDTLAEMFGHTTLLQPRTKRWAEAKVLADSLTVKVSKMYLYLNESSRAVAQLTRHVARFRELSNTWGIGEQTFEFWSWLSKQYRLFGDLIAIAIRAGFRLPSLQPAAQAPGSTLAGAEQGASTVPLHVLQHPGFYFFIAGSCATQRRNRFRALKKQYEGSHSDPTADPAPLPPPLAHESKFDHADLIIEMLTKAYEFFKAHKTKNMTFYVAAQIALAHLESGNHEMALKFHDRISKNYRRDRWREILDPILQLTVESAAKLGDNETAIRSIVELLSPDSHISLADRASYAQQLSERLETSTPSSAETAQFTIDMTETEPLFACELAFRRSTSDVNQAVPFQLTVKSPRTAFIPCSRLELRFSDNRKPVVVRASAEDCGPFTDLGQLETGQSTPAIVTGPLSWEPETSRVFCGTISSSETKDLSITSVTLVAEVGKYTLSLISKPAAASSWRTSQRSFPLLQDMNVCSFRPRELAVRAEIIHDGPAYVGESTQVHVDIANEDSQAVDVSLDLLLQPGADDSPNEIMVDDQRSASFIRDVSLGTLQPGSKIRKTFRLLCAGSAGDRPLDISIRSLPATSTTSQGVDPPIHSTETLRTLTVTAVHPFNHAFDTHVYHRRKAVKALLDMSESTGWEAASDASIVARLHAAGPWELDVLSIDLDVEESAGIRVVQSSLSDAANLHWLPDDVFNVVLQAEVAAPAVQRLSPHGGSLRLSWRRHGTSDALTTTVIKLPRIEPRPLEPTVTARFAPTQRLHQRATIKYTLSNPSPRLIRLVLQIDSPIVPGSFVFAGPRKMPAFVLAPDEERTIEVVVIPLMVGPCALPQMRVFQLEQLAEAVDEDTQTTKQVSTDHQQQQQQQQQQQAKMRELPVVAETGVYEVKDLAQVELEDELRRARGGDDLAEARQHAVKHLVVTVLPR